MAGVALAVVAIAAFRINTFSSAPTAPTATQGTAARQTGESSVSQVPPVDLGALQAERPQPAEAARDPFRFRPKPSPTVSQSGPSRQAALPPPPPPGPVEPPPPPRIPLKFIGILESKTTGLIAILSDGRTAPMSGKQGDVIDGRYRIERIGVESIDLSYVDGRGRQTIRFTGQ